MIRKESFQFRWIFHEWKRLFFLFFFFGIFIRLFCNELQKKKEKGELLNAKKNNTRTHIYTPPQNSFRQFLMPFKSVSIEKRWVFFFLCRSFAFEFKLNSKWWWKSSVLSAVLLCVFVCVCQLYNIVHIDRCATCMCSNTSDKNLLQLNSKKGRKKKTCIVISPETINQIVLWVLLCRSNHFVNTLEFVLMKKIRKEQNH